MVKALHFFGMTGLWVIVGQLMMRAREQQTLANHERVKGPRRSDKLSYVEYWKARQEAEGARHRVLNVNAFSQENLEGKLAPRNC